MLVLGDEAGFMAQLDHEGMEDEDEDEDLEEAGLEAEVGLSNVEVNLEGVDDAEVGYSMVIQYLPKLTVFHSFFSLMLYHPQ
jgi:hypothetical protein